MVTPHLLMRHFRSLGLSAEHVVLIQLLMETTWDLADPPDTMQKLADRMGVSVRTVQRYSEHLVAQHLVVVYDQFSAGAQIGNGYDLSPLFQRLAGLVQTEPPVNTSTERRVRGLVTERTTVGMPPPDSIDIPPGDSPVTPQGGSIDIPGGDDVVIPTVTALSGFKRNTQELPKKEKKPGKQPLLPASCLPAVEEDGGNQSSPLTRGGYSLRWQRPLHAAEVQESASLLKQMDIGNPLRSLLAPTAAPAEVWALWAYGKAKRWSTGLMISQVYDRVTKQARPATEILPEHDEVGQLLAELPIGIAVALLQLASEVVPAREEELFNDPLLQDASDILREAARRLAIMIAQVRSPGTHSSFIRPARSGFPEKCSVDALNSRAEASDGFAAVWQKIQAELATQLSKNDWETWIKPAALLDLDQTTAVVGTPNIFVRQEVGQHYRHHIERALATEFGYPLEVEVVIGTANGIS